MTPHCRPLDLQPHREKQVWLHRRPDTSRLTRAWTTWLHGLGPWTHAVTLTCRRYSVGRRPVTVEILQDAARHFLRRVNYACFRRRAKRGHAVPSAVTYGWGTYEDHPHLHFSLAAPSFMTYAQFSVIVEGAADQVFWVDNQRKIEPYLDDGWSEYLVKHGADHLILALLTPTSCHV